VRGVGRVDRAGVGREGQQVQVLQDDGDAEHRHHRRLHALAGQRRNQQPLARPGQQGNHRPHHRQAEDRVQTCVLQQVEGQVGPRHQQLAMGQVHQAHHAERNRQPQGREGQHAAQQDARRHAGGHHI